MESSERTETIMKITSIAKRILILAALFLLAACSPGDHMIGPRSEDAWKEHRKQQEELKETWGNTEIYAYIQTIQEDLQNVNANVVFKEGFSTTTESKELDALKKLYEDMHYKDEISLDEFLAKLEDSSLRYATGGEMELQSITDNGDGSYKVDLDYHVNVDSLMRVIITVRKESDGSFHTEFK